MIKTQYQLIIALFFGSLFLQSCSEEVVKTYSADGDGVYFNYADEDALTATVNFGDSILTQPKEIAVPLQLKVMGRASDEPRKVILKAKAMEGRGEAKVVLPEVVFSPKEITKTVKVKLQRPTMRDSVFGVEVYIDSEDAGSQIGAGIKGFQSFKLYAKESYSKPAQWDNMSLIYLGPWSADKQIMLVKLTKQDKFYASYDYYAFVRWNLAAIDSLRTYQKAHPQEAVAIDIPFTNDNTYEKPWYWTSLHDRYLGTYNSNAFVGLCNALDITTANERAQLTGDEAKMKALNKSAVEQMMTKYNTYYLDGWRPGSSYKDNFYVPMLSDVDYNVVKPQAWDDEQGGKTMVEKYYGSYSPEKYRLMIKVWMAHQGANFVLNQMFPVKNEWGNVSWDESIGGEDAIKQCNQLFRDAVAHGSYSFSFPVVP